MAVVISSEENSYFSSSTLRRSHSHNNFVSKSTGFHTSNSTSRINDSYQRGKEFGTTSPSSAPSSPQVGPFDSYASTPATKLSVASDCDEDDQLRSISSEEHIILTQYDEAGYFNQVEDLEPPLSPRSGHSYTASPNDHDTSAATSRPESPEVLERAEDDIALKTQPSRHVDYLSHDWREEDIWESWKLIVSKRGEYSNAARLENASWRTWMKAKNNLSTVSPETLNWLKDCDVTWLYGPLQTGTSSINPPTGTTSSRLSKSNSFVKNKKPILKKRSMSEVMLQRSISTLSLVKQAAASVQAQQKEGGIRLGKRPGLERATTDFVTFPFSSRRVSHDGSLHPSMESSGVVSPGGGERKHIHFNEQVSQCIAVDIKGDDEDEDDEDDGNRFYDSDSDDGGIMMKRTSTKRRAPALKKKAKSPAPVGESKTIAMLPSTTLKYRSDTPDLPESAMKHSVYRSPVLSPSSSQETLRPAKTSSKMFFVDDEDEEDEEDEDDVPSIGWRSPKFGEGSSSGLVRSTSTSSLNAEPAGMRRTASGMFMPYEEGEPEASSEGMLGWVIDTKGASGDNTHRFRRGTSNASRGVR